MGLTASNEIQPSSPL